MSARIEKLIGIAALQGLPLTGYRRFGVPPGGAFDQESLLLGNALVGNPPEAFAIELSNAAIDLAFSVATRLAIVGAAGANSVADVSPGQKVSLPAPREGLRTYLCVVGGWIPEGIDSPLGRAGRVLAAGDVLLHGEATPTGIVQKLASSPASLASGPIRLVEGPQPLIDLAGGTFRVSNSSDRTGIRLDGLPPREVPELPSEPACVGAIQLTPSGQLIVIGPDGPTIGGYPKVAVVCSANLDRLAQLRPGQEVAFERIDLDVARKLADERVARLAATVSQIKIAADRGFGF